MPNGIGNMFEVRDAVGFNATRSADAVAMSLWPSRGLELWGIEIKVSRSDWQHEQSRPEKAEKIAAYCDKWWLVTGPSVVRAADEVPLAWGWMELAGDKLVVRKEAQRTEAKVCDRQFLAALLRRASEADAALVGVEVERLDASRRESFEQQIEVRVQDRLRHREDLSREVEAFEAASGIRIMDQSTWLRCGKDVGRAARAVLDSGVDETYGGLATVSAQLRASAKRIDEALAAVHLPEREKPPETLSVRRRRG